MAVRALPVHSLHVATPRTRIIRLDLQGSQFPFEAGQAVMVGIHGSQLRKPYSIASAPLETARSGLIDLLVEVEDSGGLDPHLELAGKGTLVDVEGPFGSFGRPARSELRPLLFVAGGTGIAPLRSMLIERLATAPHPTMALVYSARSAEELAYRSEIEGLATAGRLRAYLTVTRDASSWTGRRGRLDQALLRAALPSTDALCLVCGPPTLVSAVRGFLLGLGVDETSILTEKY